MPEEIISSPRNPTIRKLIRLRDNRYRRKQKLVLVDGLREIGQAVAAGWKAESIFVGASKHEATLRWVRDVTDSQDDISVVWVSETILGQIAFGQSPRQAVGLFRECERTLQQLTLGTSPLVVVLDGIEKPGNVGAVFRTADAIGADAVVLSGGRCDLFNPNVIRASLGTLFVVPHAQADPPAVLQWLRNHRLRTVAAVVDAERTLWESDMTGPLAVVIGSEARGLSAIWRPEEPQRSVAASGGVCDRLEDTLVRIPMRGAGDSLNASVSAAVILFEAARQRLGQSSSGRC